MTAPTTRPVLLTASMGVLLLGTFLLTVVYGFSSRQSSEWMKRALLVSANARVVMVVQALQRADVRVQQAASRGALDSALDEFQEGRISRDQMAGEVRAILDQLANRAPGVLGAVCMDRTGIIAAAGLPIDPDVCRRAEKGPIATITDGQRPCFAASAAVVDAHGGQIARLAMTFELGDLNAEFSRDLGYGQAVRKGLLAMVDGKPVWLIPFSEGGPPPLPGELFAGRGESRFFSGAGDMRGIVQPLPGRDVAVIVAADHDLFVGENDLGHRVLFGLIIGVGLAGAIAMTLIVRNQTRRIAAYIEERRLHAEELRQQRDRLELANAAGFTLQAELFRSRESYRILVDALHGYAIFSMDLSRHLTSWNANSQELLGYSEAEIIGKSADMLFTPEDRAAGVPDQEIRRAEEVGQARDERWHLKRDGTRFYVNGSLNAVRSGDGTLICFVKLMHDETEQHLRQRELSALKEQYQALAESMPQIVWTARPDGKTDYVNRVYSDFSGLSVDEALGHGWLDSVHPDDQTFAMEQWQRCLRTSDGYQIEHRLRRHDGSYHWFLTRARPLKNERGQIVKWFGTSTDVDDNKLVEQRLVRANQELEHFAAIASHDLQEPLRMMNSYLGLIERKIGAGFDERTREYFSHAMDAADRMQRLIRHLLEFSRVDRMDITFSQFSLTNAVAQAIHDLGERIRATGGNVTHDELPVVVGHQELLARVFQNLIINGLKYVRPGTAPWIRISAERADAAWRVAVRDNGIGVPPEARTLIFDIFQRGKPAAHVEGAGIGLATCQKIVERHGGRIWVEANPSGGSVFFFTLPDEPKDLRAENQRHAGGVSPADSESFHPEDAVSSR